MEFIRWCLEAAALGVRPPRQCDGSAYPPGSIYENMDRNLPARFLCVEIKGDWMEHTSTFGFINWQSYHRPCIYCACPKSNLSVFCRSPAARPRGGQRGEGGRRRRIKNRTGRGGVDGRGLEERAREEAGG
eukprot:1110400-Pyramimonas_sp.AAC.1